MVSETTFFISGLSVGILLTRLDETATWALLAISLLWMQFGERTLTTPRPPVSPPDCAPAGQGCAPQAAGRKENAPPQTDPKHRSAQAKTGSAKPIVRTKPHTPLTKNRTAVPYSLPTICNFPKNSPNYLRERDRIFIVCCFCGLIFSRKAKVSYYIAGLILCKLCEINHHKARRACKNILNNGTLIVDFNSTQPNGRMRFCFCGKVCACVCTPTSACPSCLPWMRSKPEAVFKHYMSRFFLNKTQMKDQNTLTWLQLENSKFVTQIGEMPPSMVTQSPPRYRRPVCSQGVESEADSSASSIEIVQEQNIFPKYSDPEGKIFTVED